MQKGAYTEHDRLFKHPQSTRLSLHYEGNAVFSKHYSLHRLGPPIQPEGGKRGARRQKTLAT